MHDPVPPGFLTTPKHVFRDYLYIQLHRIPHLNFHITWQTNQQASCFSSEHDWL